MQVSAIVPILLNIILSEQQSQKQNPREKVALKDVIHLQGIRNAATGEAGENATPRYRTGDTGEPWLLPLPLKSTLYPDTRFYTCMRRDEQQHGREKEKNETVIVFGLNTNSLGRLFFILTRQMDKKIDILCHAEKHDTSDKLNSRAEELTENLRKLGFDRVVFRCTALDPMLTKPSTGFTSPRLLDSKV